MIFKLGCYSIPYSWPLITYLDDPQVYVKCLNQPMDGVQQGSADLLPDDSWLEDYCD